VMKTLARGLLVALAIALPGAIAPGVALASCLQQTVAEQAANAEVVVVGVVTETRQTFVAAGGVIRFRPERVFKGSLTSEVQVYLGPSHGGPPTSVDYTAVINGERHTLYLRATTDGSYETSACAGSHAGGQTADEEKVLGTGTLVAAASADAIPPALVAALVTLIGLALIAIALGMRRGAAR
jgi:hypothetical protein